MNSVYANFAGCNFLAEGRMVCGGKWEKVSGLTMEKQPAQTYAYGVYGTQGDLHCGIDFPKYVRNTFNPQYAPVKRAPMDGPLTAVAPVEPMPAKFIERFQPSPALGK